MKKKQRKLRSCPKIQGRCPSIRDAKFEVKCFGDAKGGGMESRKGKAEENETTDRAKRSGGSVRHTVFSRGCSYTIKKPGSSVTSTVVTSGNPANLCCPCVVCVTERTPAPLLYRRLCVARHLKRISPVGFPSSTHIEFGTITNTLSYSKRFPAVSRVFCRLIGR